MVPASRVATEAPLDRTAPDGGAELDGFVCYTGDDTAIVMSHTRGEDDPVAIVRNQGIFPAPEELLLPYGKAHYVGGDARGSHNMPLMPVPANMAVTGAYCLPVVSRLGFSLNAGGQFPADATDFFDNPAWETMRHKAQEKAFEMRSQGWSGPAMLPYKELEYSGFRDIIEHLWQRFEARA